MQVIENLKIPEPKSYFGGVTCIQRLPSLVAMFERRSLSDPMNLRNICHHRFNLIFVLSGEGSLSKQESVYRLTPGTAILIFPFQNHYYFNFDSSLHWIYFSFDWEEFSRYEPLRHQLLRYDNVILEELKKTISDYLDSGNSPESANCVPLHLALLLEKFLNQSKKQSDILLSLDTEKEFLEKIQQLVHRSLEKQLSISEVAASMGLSDGYVQDKFKKIVGVSLGHYIRNARIAHASGLISTSSLSLGEIAEKLGFSSPYSLSRCFKEVTGMSPREFKQTRLKK